LGNGPISEAEMAEIRASYDDIFARCHATPGGFLHGPDRRKTLSVPEEERLAFWEDLYAQPGFGIWLGNFMDTMMDEAANAALTDFIESKIRARVDDQAVADDLVPKDHGFGTRRVPLETRYYEQYNLPHVRLVNAAKTPMVRVTRAGIQTTDEQFEFDVIIYATGFDAVTGAFDHIDIRGCGGVRLRDKWRHGPVNTLGVQSAGFPNLITLVGPQGGSGSTNFPRGIEDIVGWATSLLVHARQQGVRRVAVTEEAEVAWTAHVVDMASRMLLSKQRSWLTGYNPNLDEDAAPKPMFYAGGAVRYRDWLDREAADGYPSFTMT
jgi:cation diffusion facilitator CzcD-associated flavoprotein CzcO